jgi:TolB protein
MNTKISGLALGLVFFTAVSFASSTGARAAIVPSDGLQGTKIAFTQLFETAGCPETVEDHGAEIWVMNADRSMPRQLTHNKAFDLGAVWSPNGKTVAFYQTQFDPLDKPLGPPHVYLIKADGSDQTLLTDQRSRWPSFSPNGKKIAFDNGDMTSGDIFVINTDGTQPEQLTGKPGVRNTDRNIRPDWSPDGRKIAFTSRRNGNDEIYVMNADGTDQTNLTNYPAADDSAPAWSPDGKKILFQTNRDGNDEIYVMNADGTDQTNLSDYPGRDQDPAWSPNGKKIAFHRDIDIQAQILEVFVMNADGSEQTPLTELPTENGHPGWGHGPALVP